MTESLVRPAGLVADASVLIDYGDTDPAILGLVARHTAPLRVPTPVLAEVRSLPEQDAAALGIQVVEPTLAQAMEAAAARGSTSFQDRLCLLLARDAGWSVLTNDTALRKACAGRGVPCLWGLEVMALAVSTGSLGAARALAVAQRISRVNSFITRSVLDRFRIRIGL